MPRVSLEGGDMHRTLAWAMRVAAAALEMEGKKADERTQTVVVVCPADGKKKGHSAGTP